MTLDDGRELGIPGVTLPMLSLVALNTDDGRSGYADLNNLPAVTYPTAFRFRPDSVPVYDAGGVTRRGHRGHATPTSGLTLKRMALTV